MRSPRDETDYENIALGKPARKSSSTRWSPAEDAGAAVNGRMPEDFAFHTAVEDRPWWDVDLQRPCPLDRIVIHNRVDEAFRWRARSLKVEVSLDAREWTVVHAGICHFGSGEDDLPLVVPLRGHVCARHVRLSLCERQALHLAQVEIYGARADQRVAETFESFGFDWAANLRWASDLSSKPYRLKAARKAELDHPVIGLSLVRYCRFGNNLIQLANAVILARFMGLRYIRVFDIEGYRIRQPYTAEGITFLPPDASLPDGGGFLEGNFFYVDPFAVAFPPALAEERYRAIRNAVLPRMDFGAAPGPVHDRELAIHIRSGDIFAQKTPHPGYVQPPLAFYRVILDRLLSAGEIDSVCLVFEDRGNPCISALERHMTEVSIPFRLQSGTLAEDIATLTKARHLAFGNGSFGPAICALSRHVASVHCFGSAAGFLLPNVDTVIAASDAAGGYIRTGDWRRTPDQLKTMLDYPAENLRFQSARHAVG